MLTIIKKGSAKTTIKRLLAQLYDKRTTKGFNAHKFCGVLKINSDALALQRKIRNEWQ